MQQIICRLEGYFSTPASLVTNTASVGAQSASVFRSVSSQPAPIPADLAISKSVLWLGHSSTGQSQLDLSGGEGVAAYRIAVDRIDAGGSDITLHAFFRIIDQMRMAEAAPSVIAEYLPESLICRNLDADENQVGYFSAQDGGSPDNCLQLILDMSSAAALTNTAWSDLTVWGVPNGAMAALTPGGRIELDFQVRYILDPAASCSSPEPQAIRNYAFLGLAGSHNVLSDQNNDNNVTGHDDATAHLITGIQISCPQTPSTPTEGIDIEKLRWLPSDWPPMVDIFSDPFGWFARAWQCITEWLGSFAQIPWNDNAPWDGSREDVFYYIRITNTTDNPITNIQLNDRIESVQDTYIPPFTAQLTNMIWIYCPDNGPQSWPIFIFSIPPNCYGEVPNHQGPTLGGALNTTWTQFIPGPARNSWTPGPSLAPPASGAINHYGATAPIWQGRIQRLPPGESAVLRIGINFSDPWCDAVADSDEKRIRNRIIARYQVLNEDTQQLEWVEITDAVEVEMERPDACDFNVTKELTPTISGAAPNNQIVFGEEFNYTVTYTNEHALTQHVGTVIDALRIATPNYAPSLSFRYRYDCTPLVPDSVRHFSAANAANSQTNPGFTEAFVQHVGQPNQGTRIIQQTPGHHVVFDPGASLRCNITIIVDRPPLDNPWCLSNPVPELENLALMDTSLIYNQNFQWPPSPEGENWARVRTPLPRCYDLNVEKSVAPLATGINGPPLTFNVTVSNLGQGAVTGEQTSNGWFGPVLTDQLDDPYPLAGSSPAPGVDPCLTPQCEWAAGAGLAGNPSIALISNLPQGQQAFELEYVLPPPYPSEEHRVCNTAVLSMAFPTAAHTNLWYPRLTSDHTPISVESCALITGEIEIIKTVESADPHITAPQPAFPATVSCVLPNQQALPAMSVELAFGAPTRVTGIPFGSICTVSEQPPQAQHGCVWEPSYPEGDTVTVTSSGAAQVQVLNTYVCPPTGSVRIGKLLDNQSGAPLPQTPFNVSMNCMPPDDLGMNPLTTMVTLTADEPEQSIHGITGGSICSITETPPPAPPGCLWETSYPLGDSAVVPPDGLADLQVSNAYHCLETNSLSLEKQVENLSDTPVPGDGFDFTVNCVPPTGYGLSPDVRQVSLSSGQVSALLEGIYAGSTCSVTESPPAGAAPGCWWETGFDGAASALVPAPPGQAAVTAVNTYQCLSRHDVTVTKAIAGDSDPVDPATSFPAVVHCAPPAVSYGLGPVVSNFSLSPDGQHVIENVAAGSQCVVYEPPPAADFGCSWETGYPGGDTLTVSVGGANTLTVQNAYSCERTGFIAIDKTFENGSPDVIAADMFAMLTQIQPPIVLDISCQPPAGSQYDQLNVQQLRSADQSGTVQVNSPMPVGSVCTLTETPPPVFPEFCSWSPVYPQGQQAAITQEGEAAVISLVNVLSCDIDPPILTIRKERMSADPNCTDCEFRITITNTGGLGYDGPLTVSDVAGQGDVAGGVQTSVTATLIESGDPSTWSCTQASPAAPINCTTLFGVAIDPGEAVTLDIRIQSDDWQVNCASLTTPDEGASSCFPRLPPVPDIGIEKTIVSCDIGGECIFEVTVTNHGPGTYYAPGMHFTEEFTSGSFASGPEIEPAAHAECGTYPSGALAGINFCGGANPVPEDYFPEGESRTYQLTFQGVAADPMTPHHIENCVAIFDRPGTEMPWLFLSWHHHAYLHLFAHGYDVADYGGDMELAIAAYLDDFGLEPAPHEFGDLVTLLGPGFDFLNPPMDDPSNNRSCASNFDPPDLQIFKTQVEPVCSGGDCEFQITIVNNGETAYSGPMQIVDTVGYGTVESYSYYGTTIVPSLAGFSDPELWNCTDNSGPYQYFVCWLEATASIPPNGGTITLNLTLHLPPEVPWDINCAFMVVPFGVEENEACATVTILAPQLEIEKDKLTPWYCHPGLGLTGVPNTGECVYRIRIRNTGGSEYAGPLSVADTWSSPNHSGTMPSGPGSASVVFELVSHEPETWTCVETGSWPLIECSTPNAVIPAGGHTDLFLVINQGAANPIGNCAQLTSPHVDSPVSGGPVSCSVWEQLPPPSLEIVKETLSNGPCHPDAPCTFRISIVNTGPSDYHGPLSVHDALGQGIEGQAVFEATTPAAGMVPSGYVSHSEPDWSCVNTGNWPPVLCTHPNATVPAGGSSSFELTIAASPNNFPTINCARLNQQFSVGAPPSGPISCAPIDSDQPLLEITKEHIEGLCQSSLDTCRFRITVTNTGQAPYSGPLTIEDALAVLTSGPDAFSSGEPHEFVSLESHAPSAWTCQHTGAWPPVECTHSGVNLQPGESVSLELTLRADHPVPVDRNCARLRSPPVEGASWDGPVSCAPVSPIPQLEISKRQISPICTDNCEFQITITNSGSSAFTGPLTVHDAAGLGEPGNYWSHPGDPNPISPTLSGFGDSAAWSCTHDSDQAWPIQCESNGAVTLQPGESITLDLSLFLPPQVSWDINCARLAVPAGAEDSCIPLGSPPELQIEKVHVSGDCTPSGTPCRFRITVTNTGAETYSGPLTVEEAMAFITGGQEPFTSPDWPPSVIYDGHTPADWSCAHTNSWPPVSCHHPGVSLPAGGSVSVEIDLRTNHPALTTRNCVRLSEPTVANAPAGGPTACSPVSPGPELYVTKTKLTPGVCHGGWVPGQPNPNHCTFAITIGNASADSAYNGPITFLDAAGMAPDSSVLTAAYPPGLNGLVGFSAPAGWSCQETGGWPNIECSNPSASLDPGETVTIELTLNLNVGTPFTLNCAEITEPLIAAQPGASVGPLNGGPLACVSTWVPPQTQLRIEKTGMGEARLPVGALSPLGYDFTLRVTNDGPAISGTHTVTVSDAVPEILEFHGVTANGWDCGPASQFPLQHPGELTCAFTASAGLAAGEALPPIEIVARLGMAAQIGSTFENCASVSLRSGSAVAQEHDGDCWHSDQNHVGPYDLSVQKTGSLTGDEGSFSIAVTNAGDDYHGHGSVVINDAVPAGMVFTAVGGQGWNCSTSSAPNPFPIQAGETLSCWHSAAPLLPAGVQLPPLIVTVSVPDAVAGQTFQNCASTTMSTSAGYFEATPENNESCVTVMVPPDFAGMAPPPGTTTLTPGAPPGLITPRPDPACDPATTTLRDGACVCRSPDMTRVDALRCACPRGTRLERGRCVAPPPPDPSCDPATTMLRDGACVCRFPDMTRADALRCACPAGTELAPGEGCIPTGPQCDPATTTLLNGACVCRSEDMTRVDGLRCACPPRHVFNPEHGRCTPLFCSPPLRLSEDRSACVCPAGQELRDGVCRETGRNLDRAIEILAPVIRDGGRPPSRDPGPQPQPQPQPQPNPNCVPGGPVPC